MEIKNDYNFEDLKDACWSGATTTLKDIEEAGLENEFMEYLEEMFREEVPDMTTVNDFIWMDCDTWLEEQLGEKDTNDIDDILNYFKNKSMINYHLISNEDDEKVLGVAEQFSTIAEFYEAIEDYDTFDEFYEDYME